MDVSDVVNKFNDIQKTILEFIDDDTRDKYDQSFYDDLKNQISFQDRNEFETMLHILLNISKNHHRSIYFFQKIEQIINNFKDYIIQHFTSSEIANIFKSNQRIILFLFNEGIINNEDFVHICIKLNKAFLAQDEIEQNFDLFFKNEIIFEEIMCAFNNFFINYSDKFYKLILKQKVLNNFNDRYSNRYNHKDSIKFGQIDFSDIYIKFKSFVEKEIDKQKNTLIKYLFFIPSHKLDQNMGFINSISEFTKYVNNPYELRDYNLYSNNIMYKFMFLQFKSYQDGNVCIPNDYHKICKDRNNDVFENIFHKSYKSFYEQFSTKLFKFLINNQKSTTLDNFIFSKIDMLHKPKNQNEKLILMSKINLFIEKLQKNIHFHSFLLKKFCQLVAFFVDDIIETILEFEFTDFLQDVISLLKLEYQKSLEKSKIPKDKLLIGENDSHICNLIRNDMIKEFIILINQENIPLSSKIKKSLCETNEFLMNKKTTLIEYAAFFGSIQIFKYLMINGVKLDSYIWLYAVYGRNAEIINILEENNVKPYKQSIGESINCHHNEIVDYLKNNYFPDNEKEQGLMQDNSLYESIKSHNFEYYPRCIDFNSDDISLFFSEYCPSLFKTICNDKKAPVGIFNKIRCYKYWLIRKTIYNHNDPFLIFINNKFYNDNDTFFT